MKNQYFKYHYFNFVVDDYYRYNPETETVEFYHSPTNKWLLQPISYNTLLKSKYCKEISEEQFKLEML